MFSVVYGFLWVGFLCVLGLLLDVIVLKIFGFDWFIEFFIMFDNVVFEFLFF